MPFRGSAVVRRGSNAGNDRVMKKPLTDSPANAPHSMIQRPNIDSCDDRSAQLFILLNT